MTLFEYETILPFESEDVFGLTVDLEVAPHWHPVFRTVRALTSGPIGEGSRWRIDFAVGKMFLEIVEFRPPVRVVFKGERVATMTPGFTIDLHPEASGTTVRYTMHPQIPFLLVPLMKVFSVPIGRRDLNRYFDELGAQLSGRETEFA